MKQKGFTPIEILVIIVVVLVLTAGGVVGLPAVRQVWEKRIIKGVLPTPTPISEPIQIPTFSQLKPTQGKWPWENSVCGNGICDPCENTCCNYPCVTDPKSGQLMCPPPTCLGYCPQDCKAVTPTPPSSISCQSDADCPPSIGVCIPGKCPSWRCISGRCVYFEDVNEVSLCKLAGGVYRTFPTTCADSCEFVRKGLAVFCGEAMTDSCDCGPDKCWNGTFCEPN